MMNSYAFRTLHCRAGLSVTSSINRGMYRSPRLGYVVRWTRGWSVQSAAECQFEPSCEKVELEHDESSARISMVCADRREMLDPAETVRYWRSPFYLNEFMEPGTVVVFSDHSRSGGAVVLVGPDEETGELMVTLKETFTTGHRTSVRVTLTAPIDTFEEVCRQARESLWIDGRSALPSIKQDVLTAILH